MNVEVFPSLLMAHVFMISFHLKVVSRFGVGIVARKTKYQEFKSLSFPSIYDGKVIIWFKCGLSTVIALILPHGDISFIKELDLFVRNR